VGVDSTWTVRRRVPEPVAALPFGCAPGVTADWAV
jgi:hypothetical protein